MLNQNTKIPDTRKQNEICMLAETNFRNQRKRFGIKRDDRRRHMYLLGKTGMGKSTVMENMIIQDIRNGEGVAVVDPHGDLAEKIIKFIPNERINDVIYFNPSDINFPIAFNVMEADSQEHKHLIASGLVGVFKKLWADSWGPRLEYVLRNAILALLDYPGSTMLGIMRVMVDKNYRKKVIAKIQDPVVRSFWVDEYSKYPQNFQTEAIAPIQNKVGQFLSSAMIRNIVGQVKSTIDIRDVMDNQKILIMNLSKGRVGEDSSALMGAMMITKIQLAAMSRIDIPEEKREDFYLYVDEFQNFATESFANILSEARKYRLNLIIGHQYIEQLEEEVRAAVFGNVGTMMMFRVGAADATFLEQEFTPYFLPEDLVNLTKYDVYMKLMIDGVSSNPFSATTLPPLAVNSEEMDNLEKIVKVSRQRYAKSKEVVEDKIARWSSSLEDEETTTSPRRESSRPTATRITPIRNEEHEREKPKRSKDPNKERYTVNCYECGKETEIGFKPDGIRPVYCQECFQDIRKNVLQGKAGATSQEVAEVTEQPVKEISLASALQSEPVAFEKRRAAKNEPPAEIRRNKDSKPQPRTDNRDLSVKPEISKPQPNQPKKPDSTKGSQTLLPGQVVRF